MSPMLVETVTLPPSAAPVHKIDAQVLHGPKDLRLISRPLPPPQPNEVQIAIRSTTLCGSDVHYYTNYHNGGIQIKEPLSQGHESAGEVVALGSEITDLQIGDNVALEVGVPCDECEECAEGRYNVCEKMRFRSSAVSFPHFQGTLQERVNHPGKWCYKLPPSMTYDQGALLEPLAVAVHAVRKSLLPPHSNSHILVLGAGAVGLLCAAAARAQGCASVTMADIAANRLQFAQENGFADFVYTIEPRRGSTVDEKLAIARETAGELVQTKEEGSGARGKFHVTFECTGVESCVQDGIYATRNGGKVLLVGMGTPIQTLPIAAAALREVDLVGVWRYANTYPRAIEIMQAAGTGQIPDLRKMITHRFTGLEKVPDAFKVAAKTSDESGRLVVKVVVNN